MIWWYYMRKERLPILRNIIMNICAMLSNLAMIPHSKMIIANLATVHLLKVIDLFSH